MKEFKEHSFRGAIISSNEVSAMETIEAEIGLKFKLVDKFKFFLRDEDFHSSNIDSLRYDYLLLDNPTQFYVQNNHVEGVAIMDPNDYEQYQYEPEKLIFIPPGIRDLVNLKQLFFCAHFLYKIPIPHWLADLKALETLCLYACRFENLDFISELSSLKTLVINTSYIKNSNLPISLKSLTNLEYLDLEDSRIKSLPASIGDLSQLKILILDHNPIKALPKSMDHLKNLITFSLQNWNDVQPTEFPRELCKIKSLQYIYLRSEHIKFIPECIGKLTNLKELYIENCNLSSLPDNIIVKLKNLNSVHIGGKEYFFFRKID